MNILRSHHHVLRIAALATVSALALAGCGGGSSGSAAPKANGESAKTAAEILSDAGAAVAKATSVHLAGHIGGASAVGLDLRLGSGGGSGGGSGTVSTNGLVIKVTRIGHAAYFTGSKAFYQHFTNAAAAQLLEGKWLKVPATDSRFAAFSRLTDMRVLLGQILKPSGTVVKAGKRTLHGVPVIGLRDKAHQGTLYVSATGVPYPVEVVATGARPGRISFDHWGDGVNLTPPPHAIDLAQLAKLGG